MARATLLTAGLLGGAGLAWLASQGTGIDTVRQLAKRAGGAPATVTVVLVSDPGTLAAVRRAIAPERIVAESSRAFAVRDRRIVSASEEDVGPLIGAAGWTDARIDIVKAGQVSGGPAPAAMTPGGRDAELRTLSAKATLSAAEAMRALQFLE
jgi:hypothetical protein